MKGRIPVTVIALCFNQARFVLDALDSIAAQTFQDFELVVTDDASTDGSVDVIRNWIAANRPDALFISHAKNKGLCRTLNEAVAAAQGEFIAMTATDDRWMPDKLARQVAHIRAATPSPAVVYSDAEMIDESGERLGKSFIAEHRANLALPEETVFGTLADGNFIPVPATLVSTDAIRSVGSYDESLTYEDFDMWLRLADAGFRFSFLDAVLAQYRVVGTSMVNTLFIRPTAAHSRTVIRIHERWLDSGHLTEAQRERWLDKIAAAAYNLFVLEQGDAARHLAKVGLRRRNPRLLSLAFLSMLGIKRSSAVRLLQRFGRTDT